MKFQLLILGLTLSVASGYPRYIEDQNGNELELVELVPLSRVPRGIPNRPNSYPNRQRQRISGYNQGRPQQNQFSVPHNFQEMEPLVASGSRPQPIRDPLITAETGHHQPYDYVDYGAYTGGYGAFGWYSDHPVQTGY